ncbi:MAG: AAA family ATPase [Acidimicrobiia bacterium]|nr:AAA family ATPase [Acidimicrobiia bacterium]
MLLEREEELRVMADHLAGVGSAGGKVVLIRGEAGIGKSALVRAFVEKHGVESFVLFGSCDDLLTPQPLGAFWEISREETTLSQPMEKGDRRAVIGILLDLLSRGLRSTVLVIEDTHWADEATLDLIKYLGRRIARTSGLLVLTYRDGEVDHDHPLRQVIGELPPEVLVRIHLDGLSPQAIAYLAGTADCEVEEILTLTNGNPLFVTEVLASGVESVPTSIQDSVLARASKLSPEARQILDLASVIPGEAELSLIASILGPTREHMTECSRQGLLRVGEEGVSFHHELTRRCIESILNAQDRRRLNQLVLTDLAGTADPARLVHHAREADDVDSIIDYSPEAARAAMAIESYREAAAHFRLLEPYLDRIGDNARAAIVDDWARTEYYLISNESADILARAVSLHRSTGNDVALAGALTFAVRVNEINGWPGPAEAASREAITILESYPVSANLAAAVSQRAWLMKMRGDGSQASEIAERAIELAEETGDEQSLINALITKGHFTFRSGDPAGLLVLEEARSRAGRAGFRFEESLALLNMAEVAAEHRDVERAGEFSQRARDAAVRHEIRINEDAAIAHYAKVLDWKGEWAAAEDTALEAASAHYARVWDSQAEPAAVEGSESAAPQHVLFYSQLVAGQVLGPLQARQGRPAALTTLTSIWGRADTGNEMQILLPSAAGLAEYMWLKGEHDPALTARFRELLTDTRRLTFPWSAGWLVYWLWMLGELADAPEGIAEPYRLVMDGRPTEAATIWDTKGIPYERGLALMHGDEKARLEALEVFETLGATAVAAKLRRALRAEGVGVPRGRGRETRRHAAGLTARQAEVLQLLDEGLSNTEIADRLFVSPRTVETHVSAVLMKLDSSTRKEAVVRARAEGLIFVTDNHPRT